MPSRPFFPALCIVGMNRTGARRPRGTAVRASQLDGRSVEKDSRARETSRSALDLFLTPAGAGVSLTDPAVSLGSQAVFLTDPPVTLADPPVTLTDPVPALAPRPFNPTDQGPLRTNSAVTRTDPVVNGTNARPSVRGSARRADRATRCGGNRREMAEYPQSAARDQRSDVQAPAIERRRSAITRSAAAGRWPGSAISCPGSEIRYW
jgi:hypothetical protein